MLIRIIKGVSGYRSDGSSFRYSANSLVSESDSVCFDLIKHGHAKHESGEMPNRAKAIAPMISKDEIIHSVVKRGRKRV